MTAQPTSEEFETNSVLLFSQARSDILNRFNQLEVAVLKLEHRFCAVAPPRGMPLSQRLAALSSSKSIPKCSESILQQLQRLVCECEILLPLRATLVHATMKVRKRNKGRVAIFHNSFDEAHEIPLFAVLTEKDFERLAQALERLALELNGLSPDR